MAGLTAAPGGGLNRPAGKPDTLSCHLPAASCLCNGGGGDVDTRCCPVVEPWVRGGRMEVLGPSSRESLGGRAALWVQPCIISALQSSSAVHVASVAVE